ncbi:MAG: hypothetical protein M1541_16980, partial [Acidobacteria bacterium]|nr:hypothetical protein [Acidobacteriota bacterium]
PVCANAITQVTKTDNTKKMNSIISHFASNVPNNINLVRDMNRHGIEMVISHADGCRKFAGMSFCDARCSVGGQVSVWRSREGSGCRSRWSCSNMKTLRAVLCYPAVTQFLRRKTDKYDQPLHLKEDETK